MAGRGLRLSPNKKDCLILDFGDVNHTLCDSSELLFDIEKDAVEKRKKSPVSEKQMIPPHLNEKLKLFIRNHDLMSESFIWHKVGKSFVMKGNYIQLEIVPTEEEGRFNVILQEKSGEKIIVQNMTFDFAFGAAEDFAKANRALFTLSDQEAAWRDDPISDRQLSILRGRGYKKESKSSQRDKLHKSSDI